MSAGEVHSFGEALRRWHTVRRVSQLELAMTARTTQRHLSFVERGLQAVLDGLDLPFCLA